MIVCAVQLENVRRGTLWIYLYNMVVYSFWLNAILVLRRAPPHHICPFILYIYIYEWVYVLQICIYMVNVCGKRAAAILSKELTAYHKVDNARARVLWWCTHFSIRTVLLMRFSPYDTPFVYTRSQATAHSMR